MKKQVNNTPIKFAGGESWFLPNVHKSDLSTFPLQDICLGDFTFCVRVKVDWDSMEADSLNGWGGIIVRNGMHCGLVAVKTSTDLSISGEIWYDDNGTPATSPFPTWSNYLRIHEDNKDSWLDLTYAYKKDTRVLTIMSNHSTSNDKELCDVDYSNNLKNNIHYDEKTGAERNKYYFVKEGEIPGKIINYEDSWLWLGCANSFGNCEPQHRLYFNGEISKVGVFSKKLDEHEVKEFFDSCDTQTGLMKKVEKLKSLSPVLYTDFKSRTPHKSFDYSGNGNHFIKFNKDWGAL
jgi:hypothetical protein